MIEFFVQGIMDALGELSQGCCHALSTCLVEWNAGRLPAQHLVEFVRSIAWQSQVLSELFASPQTLAAQSQACELLSAADMQVRCSDSQKTIQLP